MMPPRYFDDCRRHAFIASHDAMPLLILSMPLLLFIYYLLYLLLYLLRFHC